MTDAAIGHLRDIREQWGDLLTAIDQPPAADWPPRELHHTLHAVDPDAPAVGRLPLTLREHPAPCNLDALDAAMEIETDLFALADRIAASVQTSYATCCHQHAEPDPDRWYFAGVRDLGRGDAYSPGSRALGLHWAAVWLEARLSSAEVTDLHTPVRGVLREHAERVTQTAYTTLLAALGRDGRDTALPAPCPWCGGQLTARTTSGDPMAAVVTCGTGPTCGAPAPYDGEARRVWRGADLCGLYGAMSAAQRRATA